MSEKPSIDIEETVKRARGAVNSGYFTDEQWVIVELHAQRNGHWQDAEELRGHIEELHQRHNL